MIRWKCFFDILFVYKDYIPVDVDESFANLKNLGCSSVGFSNLSVYHLSFWSFRFLPLFRALG